MADAAYPERAEYPAGHSSVFSYISRILPQIHHPQTKARAVYTLTETRLAWPIQPTVHQPLMKPRSGCEACRERHRKCYFPPGATICHGCKEAGRECRAAPKWTFLSTPSSRADEPATATTATTEDEPLPPRRSRSHKAPQQPTRKSRVQPYPNGRNRTDEAAARQHVHAAVAKIAEDNHVSTTNSSSSLASRQHGSSRDARPINEPSVQESTIAPVPAPAMVETRLTSREAFLLRLYMLKLAPSVSHCLGASSYQFTTR